MSQVKFAVQEAARRGMKLWIQDESDYPSGFAGGKVSEQYPQLTMQGLDADIRINVMPGQTLTMPTPPDTLAALAVFAQTGAVSDGADRFRAAFNWMAPAPPPGAGGYPKPWELILIRHIFRSSPTRNFNRADGTRAKDSQYSLIDYLNPEATRAFLKITHETYKQAVGDEFGKTVLGFFGDEPDYTCFMPWTPKLLDEFRQQKGYDLQPKLPLLFAPKMTDEALRVKADYYDVWSGDLPRQLLRRAGGVVRPEQRGVPGPPEPRRAGAAVGAARGPDPERRRFLPRHAVRARCRASTTSTSSSPAWFTRRTGPGTSITTSPSWPLRPRTCSASPRCGAKRAVDSGIDGKYQLDYQLVRGVNAMQIRVPVMRGGRRCGDAPAPPQAAMLAWYTNRAGYLMAIGRPAAQVGLYHPVNSMWMGDEEADRSTTKLGWQLFEHQVDWDYFDEQSLSSVATIENGGFKNLSGQVYKAIVVPSTTVISKTGLERFQAFVKAGGKVIFVGKTPGWWWTRRFWMPRTSPDLSFATLIEPSGDITPRVIAALPKPDVKLDAEFPRLTYTHRSWRDARHVLLLQ